MNLLELRNFFYRVTGLYVSRGPAAIDRICFGDLLEAAMAVRPTGLKILQVGAYDGVSFDPIYQIGSTSASELFLVEPNPSAVIRLRRSYEHQHGVTIIETAITEEEGRDNTCLYRFSDFLIDRYPEFGGTSSLYRRHLEDAFERNRHRFGKDVQARDHISESRVRALTSEQLVDNFDLSDVDVLVIDTEGADWLVLKGLLNAGLAPGLVMFESRFLLAHHLEEALVRLHNLGYALRTLDGDTIGIRHWKQRD